MNVTQVSGASMKWNLPYPCPVTATCLLVLHNNHWYITDLDARLPITLPVLQKLIESSATLSISEFQCCQFRANNLFALYACGEKKSINWNCLPNDFLYYVRVGIWISLLWVTVRMDGLFGDNIQKLKMRNWDKNFRYYSRTILLKSVFLTAYQLNCFYRAIREDCFFERSHFLITLTSSLYYLFLQRPGEQQNWTSSTWDIFKSQFVTWFVSFNFCIFLLLIIKTKTLHNHYERIISCKHI